MMTDDGPRERYQAFGPGGLGDVDLLALVLGTGVSGHSARAIATSLVEEFGGVAGIAAAPPGALERVQGLGVARAVRVHAACALGEHLARHRRPRLRVQDAASAWRLMRSVMEHLEHEELHAAYLDRRGRVLHLRRVTAGNDALTIVDPRQILRPAIQLGACSLVVAHNHPSGDPTPSAQDVEVTVRLARAADIVGVRLLDHLVLGAGRFVSLAEQGALIEYP